VTSTREGSLRVGGGVGGGGRGEGEGGGGGEGSPQGNFVQ
jgi:hypothetical protein